SGVNVNVMLFACSLLATSGPGYVGPGHPVIRMSSFALPESPESEYGTEEITVAAAHVSPPARIASGLRPRCAVGVGDGGLLAGVAAGERRAPRALANRSSN